MDSTIRFGAMRLDQIGGNRATTLQQIGGEQGCEENGAKCRMTGVLTVFRTNAQVIHYIPPFYYM